MVGASTGLRRRARRLEQVPRSAARTITGDVDRSARRIGGTMSGLGGQLHTEARARGTADHVEVLVRGVPRAAWGVAQKGARRHPIGAKGERMRVGRGVKAGPLDHPGVRRRRAWSRVLEVAARDASRVWADQVHEAVSRG